MISASGAPSSQSRIRIISGPPLLEQPSSGSARVGADERNESAPLHPGRAFGRRPRAGPDLAFAHEAEVHALTRPHPAADDAAGESDQERDGSRGRAGGGRLGGGGI